jgi:hypothetical protein
MMIAVESDSPSCPCHQVWDKDECDYCVVANRQPRESVLRYIELNFECVVN